MNCVKCGKNIPETLDYCPNCKINEMKEKNNDLSSNEIIVDESNNNIEDYHNPSSKNLKEGNAAPNIKRNGSSITSFWLALIPYILFLYCYIASGGSFDESGSGAVWWLIMLYYWSIGIPILFVSFFLAVRGLKSDKKIFSYIGLVLTTPPVLLLLFALFSPLFLIFK